MIQPESTTQKLVAVDPTRKPPLGDRLLWWWRRLTEWPRLIFGIRRVVNSFLESDQQIIARLHQLASFDEAWGKGVSLQQAQLNGTIEDISELQRRLAFYEQHVPHIRRAREEYDAERALEAANYQAKKERVAVAEEARQPFDRNGVVRQLSLHREHDRDHAGDERQT